MGIWGSELEGLELGGLGFLLECSVVVEGDGRGSSSVSCVDVCPTSSMLGAERLTRPGVLESGARSSLGEGRRRAEVSILSVIWK